MLDTIKFESEIIIKDIPIQWLPRFELYYPDLPQFPITYVHTIKNNTRIYGFPVSASFDIKEGTNCDVNILFLSNSNLEDDIELKKHIAQELGERFGAVNKIGLQDILSGCKGVKEYEDFFRDIWQYVSKIYGEYIPYGKYYEEVYSIVRFVSAWQPKTGRQSEMRMLYNFLSIFGQPINVEGKWNYLEFFLLPTYEDIKNKSFADFPIFNILFDSINIVWNEYFTKRVDVAGTEINVMLKAWPIAKDKFIQDISYPLFSDGKIDINERESIERLVDAFNRHSWRAAYFIWNIMMIIKKDYYSWDKYFFMTFYTSKVGVGVSEKVVACFLQQGFGKEEVIPIDTWVESFYYHVLGIESLEDFFNSFNKLGMIERVIWLSSQANKTNIKTFFDTLWCTRYGDTGNNELRGANPIACYECKLRTTCPGFNKIPEKRVLIKDKDDVIIEDLMTSSGTFQGKIITSASVIAEAKENLSSFICITEDRVPKKIFKIIKSRWKLVDEFSGYLLKDQKVKNNNVTISVDIFISDLPSFF